MSNQHVIDGQLVNIWVIMKVINKHVLITISFLVSFGNFVFGYSLVAISMMADQIAHHNSLNGPDKDYQLSIITTLLPIGAFLGRH